MKSLAGIALVLMAPCITGADEEKPNLIIINIDDLGYADIGPFGSKTNPTPHLDRMAAEGRKLTGFYAAPVCSPSRASLMTGCYPKRALPIPHVLFPASPAGLHPDEVTIAELLGESGYATACIGKWHLGDQPEFLPTRQGFDYYYGIPYSNDMGPAEDGAKSNPGRPRPNPANREPNHTPVGITGAGQPPLPLLENEQVIARVREKDQFAVTRQYTEKAVEFIRNKKDVPFFLYLPHTAVHFPLYPHEDFQGKSKKGLIGDWAVEVDWSVGRILDTVRDEKLAEKTFVLFTSDNGGALNHGSDNSPLRGSKGQTYEGGIRVCTIAWWPGKIPAGTSTDAITTMMDILPTLAKLGGAKVPTDRTIDGVDIWPALVGEARPREAFHYFRGANLQAVRQGPWKLHLRQGELYHLERDVAESSDVAKDHPEIVARLRRLAAEMNDDLGTDAFGPGCRPLGRVENPLPLIDHEGNVRPDFVRDHKRFP
jgi:arylsulfatase A